jgi:hypothetical protein
LGELARLLAASFSHLRAPAVVPHAVQVITTLSTSPLRVELDKKPADTLTNRAGSIVRFEEVMVTSPSWPQAEQMIGMVVVSKLAMAPSPPGSGLLRSRNGGPACDAECEPHVPLRGLLGRLAE